MLKQIIDEALIAQGFVSAHKTDTASYYLRRKDEAIRFAIVNELSELKSPEELNEEITQTAPKDFIENPAFKKNCDLICLLKLDKLAEFKELEDEIFSIEENAYHYKKYILYYSEAEEQALNGFDYAKLAETISDKSQFDDYKGRPLAATAYSLATKIFIKLPFLELPHKTRELVPLKAQAETAVTEADLSATYEKLQAMLEEDSALDDLVKELIKNEMENFQN
ncbi:ABC-three component system middle component 1 [Pseudomonas sp. EA_105y_Pfl2_R69]|uniref:ABC-three component system middle component 1 n=1 Tax=Pseudomonas sp. EA_105y_Pfl2_R69 TaxID=3088683 RepID=UPI0030DCDCF1